MKNIFMTIIMALAICFCSVSCTKEISTDGSISCKLENAAGTVAVFTVTADIPSDESTYYVGIGLNTDDPMAQGGLKDMFLGNAKRETVLAEPGVHEYTVVVRDLTTSTQYCARPLVEKDGFTKEWGDMVTFNTAEDLSPAWVKYDVKPSVTSAYMMSEWIDEISDFLHLGIYYSENPDDLDPDWSGAARVEGNKLISLKEDTRYYARVFAWNTAGTSVSPVIEFRTTKSSEFEAVDLGLSVKWADKNVGSGKPEEYGNHFAWGETSEKPYYSIETYKWIEIETDLFTKYCTNRFYGYLDDRSTLMGDDDAASANVQGGWRIPTSEEWQELISECTWTWTSRNGIDGCEVKGKNGNSIFLPAAGYRDCEGMYSLEGGLYMSSSLYDADNSYAWSVDFNEYGQWHLYERRFHGFSARPVKDIAQ